MLIIFPNKKPKYIHKQLKKYNKLGLSIDTEKKLKDKKIKINDKKIQLIKKKQAAIAKKRKLKK